MADPMKTFPTLFNQLTLYEIREAAEAVDTFMCPCCPYLTDQRFNFARHVRAIRNTNGVQQPCGSHLNNGDNKTLPGDLLPMMATLLLPLDNLQQKTFPQFKCIGKMAFYESILMERGYIEADEDIACRLCGAKDNGGVMLLCDGCNMGCHTYCLQPPLSGVPEEDWFCEECKEKRSGGASAGGRRRITPVLIEGAKSGGNIAERSYASVKKDELEEWYGIVRNKDLADWVAFETGADADLTGLTEADKALPRRYQALSDLHSRGRRWGMQPSLMMEATESGDEEEEEIMDILNKAIREEKKKSSRRQAKSSSSQAKQRRTEQEEPGTPERDADETDDDETDIDEEEPPPVQPMPAKRKQELLKKKTAIEFPPQLMRRAIEREIADAGL